MEEEEEEDDSSLPRYEEADDYIFLGTKVNRDWNREANITRPTNFIRLGHNMAYFDLSFFTSSFAHFQVPQACSGLIIV
jgi:hypothetical protein